jgi:prevent-host-death family protein
MYIFLIMKRYLSASEARQRFLKLLDETLAGDQIVVTRHGSPVVVMIDFERLETLKSLARLWQDPEALHAMRVASEDVAAGRTLRSKRMPRVRELLKKARAGGLLRG